MNQRQLAHWTDDSGIEDKEKANEAMKTELQGIKKQMEILFDTMHMQTDSMNKTMRYMENAQEELVNTRDIMNRIETKVNAMEGREVLVMQ